MEKQLYIDYLKETAGKTTPIILELVDAYKDVDGMLHEFLMHFVGRRLNKPLLKPALVRATYELCGGQNWERILPASAAFELINISSYQANSAFDGKLKVLTKLEKEAQFIAAMISRELSQFCLDRLKKDFNAGQIEQLTDCLSQSNKFIYQAQHWDLNLLTWDNLEKYRDEQFFLKEYTKRCFYGSGVFTGQCAIAGGVLAGASDATLEKLKQFGESYGTALHMINDIGDFVPSSADDASDKDYQDRFSDFRNRRLTLPIYHLFTLGNAGDAAKARQIASRGSFDLATLAKVAELLLTNRSFDYAQTFVSAKMEDAAECLALFSRSAHRDVLSTMVSVGKSNKYYNRLKSIINHEN